MTAVPTPAFEGFTLPHGLCQLCTALPGATQTAIAQGFAPDQPLPTHWMEPGTVAELQQVVDFFRQQRWSLMPCGQGSKLSWGGLGKAMNGVVSTRQLNRIIDHAVADLTVTVEAGIPLQTLQAYLAPYHQFLPLDPLYGDRATLGGIMATGQAGSWQQRYGGVRDLILGFSFVRWDGKVAKAGGRVVKNVAGYDLMKLFTGSYGTLGIITEMTLRLYPLPSHSQTLTLSGPADSLAQAVATLRRSGLTPTAAEGLSAPLANALGLGSQLTLVIRFQNDPLVVQAQADQIHHLAQALSLTCQSLNQAEENAFWPTFNHAFTPKTDDAEGTLRARLLCRIGLLPAQIIHFLHQVPGLARLQLGTGLGYFVPTEPTWEDLHQQRIICQNAKGYLTLLEAPPSLKQGEDVWGYSGSGLALMAGLKQQFDPLDLFNPGRFVGGL